VRACNAVLVAQAYEDNRIPGIGMQPPLISLVLHRY
jgi:hypothetical protein